MWLNYGKCAMRITIALILAGPVGVVISDSPAFAGLLKNSVKVGDRSKMTIVATPSPGQRKRIIITPPAPKVAATPAPAAVPRTSLAWFWDSHSTAAASASTARWGSALESLRQRRLEGPGLYSRERMRGIAAKYALDIASASQKFNVSEVLLLAVIAVESAGQSKAISPKGARGLMQLIPATASRFGVANSFDPAENILGGAAYLDWLLKRFGGDPILALAGYNAGEGAVDTHKGVPPYAETRDYVVKVFDALAAAETLCLTGANTPRHRCGWPSAPRT